MANIASEVFPPKLPNHGIAVCGFSFAYAASRKTAASAIRPTISRIGPQAAAIFHSGHVKFSPPTGSAANQKIASGSARLRFPKTPDNSVPCSEQ